MKEENNYAKRDEVKQGQGKSVTESSIWGQKTQERDRNQKNWTGTLRRDNQQVRKNVQTVRVGAERKGEGLLGGGLGRGITAYIL